MASAWLFGMPHGKPPRKVIFACFHENMCVCEDLSSGDTVTLAACCDTLKLLKFRTLAPVRLYCVRASGPPPTTNESPDLATKGCGDRSANDLGEGHGKSSALGKRRRRDERVRCGRGGARLTHVPPPPVFPGP